jgi:glucose-6-phosphate isomerase
MTLKRIDQTPCHDALLEQVCDMAEPTRHLKHLLEDPKRLIDFSARGGGLYLDYARQRLTRSIRDLLIDAAQRLQLPQRFEEMCRGKKINVTEGRAVLHTATRQFGKESILVDGEDVMPEIRRVNDEVRQFSGAVLDGQIRGATGSAFRHVVVVGIGGSYLGTEFVATALAAYAQHGIALHFLSNVDVHNFGAIAGKIDPPSTLWIIISKSYTTAETMANANLVQTFMRDQGLDPARHMVTVTAKGSPGDDPDRPVLRSFHMFDFIGGRYSVTSAVGTVPLSLYLGYDKVEAFLKGAHEMDTHARTAPPQENLPMLAALISVWNTTYLGYAQQAIIPYAAPLAKLAPHIQQLNMESNGKSVDIHGHFLPSPAGTVIFGEPGTNAQHSFFQLAHQGPAFPVDFIGVLKPQYPQYDTRSKGVTNHQELWANMLAQAKALAEGEENTDRARHFSGNRPSSTLVLEDLSPANLGRLLSFYEARTVFEGFIWGINSFDQFGVQLGKTLATGLRSQMAQRNQEAGHSFDASDPIGSHYLEMLYAGKL